MKKLLAIIIMIMFVSLAFLPMTNGSSVPTIKSFLLDMHYKTSKDNIMQQNDTMLCGTGDREYWALLVGLNDYEEDNKDIMCPHGAGIILDALLQSENWKQSNIKILANKDATKENLLNSDEGLNWLIGRVGPGDIVLFFFNGHGDPKEGTNGIHLYYYDDFVTTNELNAKFDQIDDKGVESLVIIFDSCNSGGVADDFMGGVAKDGRVVLTSSSRVKSSYYIPG